MSKDEYLYKTAHTMKEVQKLLKKGWETVESSGSESFLLGNSYKALLRRPNPKFKPRVKA